MSKARTTAAMRAQRIAAGRAKKTPPHEKRRRNAAQLLGEENDTGDGDTPPASSAPRSVKPKLKYLPERVRKALEEYEGANLPVQSWQDAKAQQQTVAEALSNESRLVELEVQRGQLFSIDEIRERDERHDELFINALNTMAEWIAKDVPVNQRNDTRKRALEKVAEIRREISAELSHKAK